MGDIFRKMLSNPLVFWIGFLAGIIFSWLMGKVYPLFLSTLRNLFKASLLQQKEKVSISDETHLMNAMLQKAQSWHIAQSLFSLDEIVIPPRIMLPPLAVEFVENPLDIDITDTVIPYCPDFPELAAFYQAPTISLREALSRGANLILMGHPGAGKSVALAHLTCELIRSYHKGEDERWRLPLLIHVAELELSLGPNQSVLETLIKAIKPSRPPIPESRLRKLLHTLLSSGKLLLLLDGMDELPKAQFDEVAEFIAQLSQTFPGLQYVVTSSFDYYGTLTSLDAFPMAIAFWHETQREAFIKKWITQWEQKIAPLYHKQSQFLDPRLIYGWLRQKVTFFSPLELTLTLWAASSGEIVGHTVADALEAFFRRTTAHLPEKYRETLKIVAAFTVLNGFGYIQSNLQSQSPAPSRSRTEAPIPSEQSTEKDSDTPINQAYRKINTSALCSALTDSGLMIERQEGRYSFCHPTIAAYLAWEPMSQSGEMHQVIHHQPWTTAAETLKFLAVSNPSPSWLNTYIVDEVENPTLRELFQVARWLPYTPIEYEWSKQLLRRLASVLQNEGIAETLRARALTALIRLSDIGVDVLLRRLLSSDRSSVHHLAALGCGVLKDKPAIPLLQNLLEEVSPQIQNAALLALVALGDESALEAVAYKLLHGDEISKRYAAMALSNHAEEGFSILEEASRHVNSSVRRAAVSGLFRIATKQAQNILFELQLNDSEWLVQDSATQALEQLQKGAWRVPKPLPPLHESTWLIRYASAHGIGVAPGKPSVELLQKLLRDGDEEQKLNALFYLFSKATEELLLPLYQLYFSNRGEVQEWSFFALEHLQRCGIKLPSPVQYGLQHVYGD